MVISNPNFGLEFLKVLRSYDIFGLELVKHWQCEYKCQMKIEISKLIDFLHYLSPTTSTTK